MIDAAKLQKALPNLIDYGKDVDGWMHEFVRVMELYDVVEPRRIFVWAKEAVEEDMHGALNSLKSKNGNEVRYPSFKEIQAAVEEYLHITPNDKCAVLKSLKINNKETIKKFNHRYKILYKGLPREYQKLISIKDYTTAISTRVFPCSRVMTTECETLSEAFKVAEVSEEAEKEIISNIGQDNNKNRSNLMFVQNLDSPIMNHPFYQNFYGEPSYQHNINQSTNRNVYNNNFRPPFRRNNRNFSNGSRFMNLNNNYNTNVNQNMNNIMDNNNYNYNYLPNRIQNSNNSNYNYKNNNISNDNNTNNIATAVSQNSNAYDNNNGIDANILTTTINRNPGVIPNKEYNKSFNKDYQNRKTTCFRCFQNGHKASNCPYSFKQLAEMEERGMINKSLNH